MSRRSVTRLTLQLSLAMVLLGWTARPDRAGEVKKPAVPEAAPPAKTIYTKDNAPAAPELEDLPLNESVSQYGITWTFEEPARVGRFITGDWYVVGPVTVTRIDPKPLWGDEVGEIIHKDGVKEGDYEGKTARNGSVLNPRCDRKNAAGYRECAGFDSRIPHGRYDPDQFAHLPIRMKPGDSLVSTISRRNDQITRFSGQHVDPLRVAAVLTCLAEPQPADAFRPSYCDTAGCKPHLARDLRRELLLSLPRTASVPEGLDEYVAAFQKPWLDVVEFGFAAPVENLPHYGQNVVNLVGEAGLLLHLDYSAEAKEPLLVHFVQAGIDFWGLARTGRTWPAHGGLNSGRKWPILFAGLMLDDPEMQSPNKTLPNLHFHEDDQTAMCPYEYRGKVYERGWTGARAIFTGHSLAGTGGSRGRWEDGWGTVDLYPPSEWPRLRPGSLPASEGYRRANTSNSWVGQALAARLMHVEGGWAHDALFAYVDRWMTEDDTPFVQEIKKAGGTDYTGVEPGRFGRQGAVMQQRFVQEMWETYRNKLPPAPDGHRDPPAEETWR
jgi:hypothetical protein